MKLFKLNLLFAIAALLITSCAKDDDTNPGKTDETENLSLVKTITKDDYTIELFNKSGELVVGYNKMYLRITDKDDNYVNQATISWMPLMTMNMNGMTKQHSCPYSPIKKADGKETLFEAYIVFIMASDEPDNFWELKINLNIDGQELEVNERINVVLNESEYNKLYTSAMGSDDEKYMLALIEPSEPIIGSNPIVVGLFKKESMMSFPKVDNYSIKVDPRMPGMGNHSAPGNEDMTQRADGLYEGKVGFSMSGYWKINLIIEDGNQTLIKGEAVTEQNTESSLHFKLEF